MFCPNCGTQNNDGVNFCANCGAKLYRNAAPSVAPIVAMPQQKTNVLCIVGLIASLASILFLGTTAIIGLIFSLIGLISAGKKNEKGKGQAIAGIIISSILVLVWIFGIFIGLTNTNRYKKRYTDYTTRRTTAYEETTSRTTRETTEETSASRSNDGAYLSSVGNYSTGTVPLTQGKWVTFIEAGGFSSEVVAHEQAQDMTTGTIIGLFVLNVDYSAEDLGKSQMYSMEQAGAKKVTGARVKIGGYDAVQCYGYYPDGTIFVVWFFKGDDGQMRKVTVEFKSDDHYSFNMVEKGYTLDR